MRAIRQDVTTNTGKAKSQSESKGRALALPTIKPNPYLKPAQIQEYCRTEHGWINDWKGHGKRWFEVGRAIDQDHDATGRDASRQEGQYNCVEAEHDATIAVLNIIQEEDERVLEKEVGGRIHATNDKWRGMRMPADA
ncbi:unnamed protein product [Fusarium equiseti]|uniref:Uncharacterized protein n=1 Tax=Fusarium equiseti TaxID=61235 RepID=A0A8J2IYT0_FUSEQ|nr:unnamed protein product [Fusarium equiseti]